MSTRPFEFEEDIETSSNLLRIAVPMMVKLGIPPTPYNYALWYAHAQDSHPDLSKALLEQFPGSSAYTPDKSEALFFEYFVKGYLANHAEADRLLVDIIFHLGRMVSKNAESAKRFGESLQDAMDALADTSDDNAIQTVLDKLLDDTAEIGKLNAEFQDELANASAEVEKLKRELESSRHRARIDELTQLANRRAFDETLQQALTKPGIPPVLLMLDLDHFKRCNDQFGHLTGDRILKNVGELLAEVQTPTIFAARYGGEEMAVIVNQELEAATRLANELRRKIASMRVRRKETSEIIGTITVSIGVAQARAGDTPEGLIERADAALYQAKEQGRDQVIVADAALEPNASR